MNDLKQPADARWRGGFGGEPFALPDGADETAELIAQGEDRFAFFVVDREEDSLSIGPLGQGPGCAIGGLQLADPGVLAARWDPAPPAPGESRRHFTPAEGSRGQCPPLAALVFVHL